MGRNRGLTRGRAFPVVLAGMIGYLIGGWHPTALRSQNLSAAQSVAQRFPQRWDTAAAADGDADVAPPVTGNADLAPPAGVLEASAPPAPAVQADAAEFVLLSPEPMAPPPVHPPASQPAAAVPAPQAPVQLASAETAAMPPAASAADAMRSRKISAPKLSAVATAPDRIGRVPAAQRRGVANRPGFMLDDAQIASIKRRLHLTPDQEQMWPAVEAALRNIAYTRAQAAQRRGGSGAAMQVADIDPQSVEGLKSAAVPLIMSFNEEQKQEVRDLAHVMGLDQLASEF